MLAPSCGTFLSLCATSGSCRARLCAHNLPFAFPRAGPGRPADSGCFVRKLTSCLRKLTLGTLGSGHGESATGSEGRCVGELYEVLEVSVDGLGGSVGEPFPVLMAGLPLEYMTW